ncbi:N,N-dimethylformamidase beta subunit [Roseovarius litorisediminis]|uniref:N,N-dimethylformamidase beta subunit n=1 Tax=Roseovarius litorisediminis TaxID=1312363 RepID=A0A1Y5RQU9_9RHOB|nr:N,N-dimethylformamidase beta subunit family domain-containing protein [Roseovarius litorisediminis]SLN23208.1 N,N-dimethylformamidase beta subunit [Roseovarius litorisediminis]
MKEVPLAGYTDRLSARPGETIEFKVSSHLDAPFRARLMRSICADPNPAGQGIVEEDASAWFTARDVPSRHQPFFSGSYGTSDTALKIQAGQALTLAATILPTRITGQDQVVLGLGPIALGLDAAGHGFALVGNQRLITSQPLTLHKWARISAEFADGYFTLTLTPISRDTTLAESVSGTAALPAINATVTLAARQDGPRATAHFNGKVEAPSITSGDTPLAVWDLAANTPSARVPALTGPGLTLINFPARGMTGSGWDASEMCWRHKPDHYGAIHFHDDDLYDFGWETDFSFTIPDGMPSGVYVMRIEGDSDADAMPFYVCPPKGERTSDLCVLIPTFTYVIYGNHARPDYNPSWQKRIAEWGAYPYNAAEYRDYGMSTYNTHSDGSGICHASHHRPLFNLRPGYLTFCTTPCSGLRHFQADSHLISWLHAKSISYDIITDTELHEDGAAAIAGYKAVTTTTHPEYHTAETLDALREYRDSGGNLLYLGGNGFYWRIARHRENNSLLEIRRAEDGIRAWAAEPGEYYNAFDGTYGGLWRRSGRAPQDLVGIGFAAQGEFYGSPYLRLCKDPAFDWLFEGIENDVLGDFGFSGNGAAGFELDHVDHRLGSPKDLTILARSTGDNHDFMLVPEEMLTHLTNLTGGSEDEAKHADMIYFDCSGGGSVFSTGSITFCGSLPWNDFDNDISRLLENYLRRKVG